jgi:hypothetical protein
MKACVGAKKKKMCSLTNAGLVVVNPRDMIFKITSAAGLFSTLQHIEPKRGSRTKSDGSVSRRFVRLFAYVGRIGGE